MQLFICQLFLIQIISIKFLEIIQYNKAATKTTTPVQILTRSEHLTSTTEPTTIYQTMPTKIETTSTSRNDTTIVRETTSTASSLISSTNHTRVKRGEQCIYKCNFFLPQMPLLAKLFHLFPNRCSKICLWIVWKIW